MDDFDIEQLPFVFKAKKIDAEKLINEVKKWSVLHDVSNIKYDNYNYKDFAKKGAWFEVCKNLEPDWIGLSAYERDAIVEKYEEAWEMLTKMYIADYKYQKALEGFDELRNFGELKKVLRKTPKCAYYDELHFLAPDAERAIHEDDVITMVQYAIQDGFDTSSQTRNYTKVDSYLSIINDYKEEPEDYDRMFLLSLLPVMKLVPEDRKLKTKIELQRTLRLAVCKHILRIYNL